ncbi:radical SAM protein [Nocardia sp. CDC159]|uniref:Radical SAM protein n=1 Tax=Nocardia pulmonis TaxID=2951408 RepID=A0A9X2IXC7_9NOCA|nr:MULTISPECIES: radical SAM protein [Nocardia]MCM6774504.1 radical SAM protein [Nocardia pulmonis]MCM6787430.1 radical SAM protein [Nocardia sp. CDC159]
MATDSDSHCENLYRTLTETGADTAVSVILKLRGETCDIDCLYCFEKRKEAPGGARIGVEDIVRLPALFGGRPVVLELHGGEPLTAGQPYIREVLTELARQPVVQRVTLQTNGIRLDESWLDLFDEVYPALRIGISLDGDRQGNSWRVGYDGQPTYARVEAALDRCGARGRAVGVITVVTPRVLGRAAAVLDHLVSFSAVDAISVVPCFDTTITTATASSTHRATASRIAQRASITAAGPAWAISPDEYVEFVLAAAIRWVHSGAYRRVKLEPVVSAIRRLQGLDTGFCHFSNLKCDHVFTLYPGGRFGSCDELPWPAAQLADMKDLTEPGEITLAQRRLPILTQGRELVGKCRSCRYHDSCGGGCVASRLRAVAATGSDDAYCRHRMRLIDGVAALITTPTVPSAVFCRHAHARPRRINEMADVAGFLASWCNPSSPRSPVRLELSEHGNINTLGEPGIHEADDLDPLHPSWRDAIEPGVWPLVDTLTSTLGLVTYDSCQGHPYPGLSLEPVERRVGILPRTRDEYATIAAALCRVITAIEALVPQAIRIAIGRAELTCTTSGGRTPVLDLRLERADGHDWPAYFASIDAATTALAGSLAATTPGASSECGCVPPGHSDAGAA